MSGKKKKNNSGKKPERYSQEDVFKAVTAVSKGMSLRKAEQEYKVPRSTINAKMNFVIPIEAKKGSSTFLTAEEETQLVDWIFYCAVRGCPFTKSMLVGCVKTLVEELGRVTPFEENKPGRHWYEAFMRRHPEVTTRVTQNLSTSRAAATVERLKEWFSEVKIHLEPLNLIKVDASRVFNLDESAFFLYPKGERVLAPRGSRAVYRVVHGDDKECLTVMFTVNAAGLLLPPLILYWYQRIPKAVTSLLPPTWLAGTTESGW